MSLEEDAKRWQHFCCSQTALMLGSNLNPNDDSIDWKKECDRLADLAIARVSRIKERLRDCE